MRRGPLPRVRASPDGVCGGGARRRGRCPSSSIPAAERKLREQLSAWAGEQCFAVPGLGLGDQDHQFRALLSSCGDARTATAGIETRLGEPPPGEGFEVLRPAFRVSADFRRGKGVERLTAAAADGRASAAASSSRSFSQCAVASSKARSTPASRHHSCAAANSSASVKGERPSIIPAQVLTSARPPIKSQATS